MKTKLILALLLASGVSLAETGEDSALRADFKTLDAWRPLEFPDIERKSEYSIVAIRDGGPALKMVADDSASALVHREKFNPFERPILKWRWKAENILPKGDATSKAGDDYPVRVYVLFEYDPDKASFLMRARYGLARKLHGEYPPHASLNYIWANRQHSERILTSAYTERSKVIVMRAGPKRTGEWLEEEVNILADYRAAFGEDPPGRASLAVMADADNTGGESTGYIDFIEVRPGK